MTTTSRDVPTAYGMQYPRAKVRAGTMANPPPTPKKPVSRPTPVPARATLTRAKVCPPFSSRNGLGTQAVLSRSRRARMIITVATTTSSAANRVSSRLPSTPREARVPR